MRACVRARVRARVYTLLLSAAAFHISPPLVPERGDLFFTSDLKTFFWVSGFRPASF